MEELRSRTERVERSLEASTSTGIRIFSVIFLSALTFLLVAFTTDIPWHLQTLEAGFHAWDDALLNSIAGIYIEGYTTLGITIIYSIFSGLALTNIGVMLKGRSLSVKGLGGVLPGFLATGCASCGVGLAGLLGFAGLAASLPFNGNLFKIAGVLILIYALHEMGNPEICEL